MRIARHVRKLEGYVPGEQPQSKNVVKLNTNENPYPPTPKCAEALKGFDLDRLRRYPDPNFTALREALARLNGTRPENVFVGNGSDEILALAARTFVENDEAIGSLDPSYSLYKTLAAIRDVKWVGCGGQRVEVRGQRSEVKGQTKEADLHCLTSDLGPLPSDLGPLTSDLGPLTSDLGPLTSLFLWTNPNAPTGEFAEPKVIADFARKFPGVVLVDEAYADFARANCMALATRKGNRNVLVMRTFSKSYSLAGLRVGYCVGPKDLVDALYKMKDSYNVDAVAQAVALAAVNDQAWMKANVAKVVKTRTWLTAELERRGWDVIPSESNFLFARPAAPDRPFGTAARLASSIFDALRQRNIFVRYFPGPKTGDRLRITVGTDAQVKKLLKAIDELRS